MSAPDVRPEVVERLLRARAAHGSVTEFLVAAEGFGPDQPTALERAEVGCRWGGMTTEEREALAADGPDST